METVIWITCPAIAETVVEKLQCSNVRKYTSEKSIILHCRIETGDIAIDGNRNTASEGGRKADGQWFRGNEVVTLSWTSQVDRTSRSLSSGGVWLW